jgi:hypothetical protein
MNLSVDAASWARASFSWALDPHGAHHMHDCLDKMSRAELVELTLAADQLLAEACKRIRDAALPEYVEGHKIGARS